MTDPNVRQPARVIVGHCPDCRQVLVVENNYETWPWIECRCGWGGDTTEVANRAWYDSNGEWSPHCAHAGGEGGAAGVSSSSPAAPDPKEAA